MPVTAAFDNLASLSINIININIKNARKEFTVVAKNIGK